ncbi:MAG: hypothetical protein K0Q81_733 [Paenibacillus sp.]|nr:hypothetical protein [Paenibacillus sp.]
MNLNAYTLERISVAYSSHGHLNKVLDDISLVLNRGEWISIVGKNGSGKSTLAKVLARLLPVSSGGIKPGWTDRDEFSEQPGNKKIRMVMQNPESQFIGETVEEDLVYILELIDVPDDDKESVLCHALEAVGLQSERSHPIAELSGGQKQALAIAGCIAAGAELIIFDEASSMLDPHARERLLHTARALHEQGITIVWITHAMEELVYADRAVAIAQGRIVYDGGVKGFLYPVKQEVDQEESICEQLGFTPPFAVQAVRELMGQGVSLPELPLTCEELFELLEVKLSIA